MNILVFDTETTGLVDFRTPVDHVAQPWPVQIAAILFDEKGKRRAQLEIIVRPECAISPEALAVHGITADIAEGAGFKPIVGCNMFFRLLTKADMVVAHNIEFDKRIMLGASMRAGFSSDDFFQGKQQFCTMAKSKDICKIPPTEKMIARNNRGFKVPSLDEAYRHFCGKGFDDAHTAMADAQACAEIFWELVKYDGIRLGESEDRTPTLHREDAPHAILPQHADHAQAK